MEQRFQTRMQQLLDDAVVQPQVFKDVLPRLQAFVKPFAASLAELRQQEHVEEYVAGLVSNLERKNMEAIAYLHEQGRQGLQKFIGQLPWDDAPLRRELARQVGVELGEADGVIVFDPSGHPKKGTASVGVQRQWCGRLGKTDNCQVGVYMGYVSRHDHALVDTRLYLPESWAKDRARRKKAGVPKDIRFQTRHQLALEMLAEQGSLLPHAWVGGDDEMGRATRFRRDLQARQERYVLAVPSNTLVRDLEAPPPPYRGRGPHPKVPFVRVERWAAALPASAWTKIEVRAGDKGPLVVEAVKTRVQAKTDRRRIGPEETLVVLREQLPDETVKHDYYLSNAPFDTPLTEFARVAKAAHRIEECFQRAKGEAGLSHYEVRTWRGWYHHQTLSLIATWFLTQETRRGKKMDTSLDRPANPLGRCLAVAAVPPVRHQRLLAPHHDPALATNRGGPLLSLEKTQTLAALAV